MSTIARSLALPALALVIVACSTGGATSSSDPSAAPSGAPTSPAASPTPAFGQIEHPTGPTDVILRYEEGGGFVMPAFLATSAPIYTLYGDGAVIFRDPMAEPPPAQGSVFPQTPFKTAKLTEEQIQETLAYALGEGGLGVARSDYGNDMIADAGTATFTIDADGNRKVVNVYALGLEQPGMPDLPIRTQFQSLAKRLGDFDQGGTLATQPYAPASYRGILMDGQGAPDAKPWPWTDIAPADFPMPADPNAFQMATRELTPADVSALGVTPFEGGFQGLALQGPEEDGKPYILNVRPLLPGETP